MLETRNIGRGYGLSSCWILSGEWSRRKQPDKCHQVHHYHTPEAMALPNRPSSKSGNLGLVFSSVKYHLTELKPPEKLSCNSWILEKYYGLEA